MSKRWIIALSVVGGVGVLYWLAKKSGTAASSSAAAAISTPLPSSATSTGIPATKAVDAYSGGKIIGQVQWTSSPEQTQVVGPRYPDLYDADFSRFIFVNAPAQGGGFMWISVDKSTGMITGNGAGTGDYFLVAGA